MNTIRSELIGNDVIRAQKLIVDSDRYQDCWLFWDRFPEDLIGSGCLYKQDGFSFVSDERIMSYPEKLYVPGTSKEHSLVPTYLGEEPNSTGRRPLKHINQLVSTVNKQAPFKNIIDFNDQFQNRATEFSCSNFSVIIWLRGHLFGIISLSSDIDGEIVNDVDFDYTKHLFKGETHIGRDKMILGNESIPLQYIPCDDPDKALDLFTEWSKFLSKAVDNIGD